MKHKTTYKQKTSDQFFKELKKIEKYKKRLFVFWGNNKTLKITSDLERVAKILGDEYFFKTGKTAKIEIVYNWFDFRRATKESKKSLAELFDFKTGYLIDKK